MKSASESASGLAGSTAKAAQGTSLNAATMEKASSAIRQAGETANATGGFFRNLADRATSVIPGLGSLMTVAGGVATGFAGLGIAEKVGGWLLDVGTKALAGSAALKTINETVSKAQDAFQQAAGKGIETLATAITQLLGPSLEKLVSWVTEGLKWVTAFGDWFQKSGILTQIAQSFFDRVSAGFGGVGNSAKSGLAFLLDSLGLLSTKLDANGQAVIDWAGVWQNTLKAIATNIIQFLALVDFAGTKIQGTLNSLNDAFGHAGDVVHSWLVATGNAISGFWQKYMPDVVKKATATLGDAFSYSFGKLNDTLKQTPAATKGAADSLDAYVQKWTKILSGWGEAIQHQKDLNEAGQKTTQSIQAQTAATDQLATTHARDFAKLYKDWQDFLDLQQKVNAAVAAFIPTYEQADKVFQQMGRDAVSSLDRVTQAMNSLKFATDKDIDDMVYNVKTGWEKQVALAGTSTQEIMRINQAAWAQITQIVQAQWATMNDTQRQAIAQAGAEVQKSADQYGQVLGKTTADTAKATDDQSKLWQQCAQNMNRAIKQAASDITDTLWSGDKSFGEVTKSMLTDIGKMFTQTFVQTGLQAVQKFVTDGTKGLQDFFKNMGGLGGLFGGSGSTAVQTGTQTGTGTGSSAAGALSGIGGAVSLVSGAVSAISGVISNFQLKGQTKVMENTQQLTGMIFYDVHGLAIEGIAYFHFMEKWVFAFASKLDTLVSGVAGLVSRIDRDIMPILREFRFDVVGRIDRDIMPALRTMAGLGGLAIAAPSFNLQPIIDSFQSAISSIQSSFSSISLGNLSIDLSPLVSVMSDVRAALSQGALRPNVVLTVQTGVSTQQVANEIVRQLQLAGVIR
jgi:hypothetical protein